ASMSSRATNDLMRSWTGFCTELKNVQSIRSVFSEHLLLRRNMVWRENMQPTGSNPHIRISEMMATALCCMDGSATIWSSASCVICRPTLSDGASPTLRISPTPTADHADAIMTSLMSASRMNESTLPRNWSHPCAYRWVEPGTFILDARLTSGEHLINAAIEI